MKILVVSDTHGDAETLREVVKHCRSVELVLHLGDLFPDMLEIRNDFPAAAFLSVRGNCDTSVFLPDHPLFSTLAVGAHRLFYCHGHTYGVNMSLDGLLYAAKAKNADVALFGHTHVPFFEKREGVYLLNPGSLSRPRSTEHGTYGLLDITDETVQFTVKEWET